MNYFRLLIFSISILAFGAVAFGQRSPGQKPIPCTKSPAIEGKYKILSISSGKELQFYVQIAPKYRSDDNYVTVAKELLERYCDENEVRIIYYATKKQWLIPDASNPQSTPLAIFYFGKSPDEEIGFAIYTVVNGKVDVRRMKLPN